MKKSVGGPVRRVVGVGDLGGAGLGPVRRVPGGRGGELGDLLSIMKTQANTDSER